MMRAATITSVSVPPIHPGAARYNVDIHLSRPLDERETELFLRAFDHPAMQTSVHERASTRPNGNQVEIVDTTLQIVEDGYLESVKTALVDAYALLSAERTREEDAATRQHQGDEDRRHDVELRLERINAVLESNAEF
jgi:hypothetical protein